MAVLKKVIPILMPFILAGCYEDFDMKDNSRPVLCMNSLITAGEPIEVSFTHTWDYSDTQDWENHEVHDAELSIYVNGTLREAGYKPQEGDTIRLVANSVKYGAAESEVVVPPAPTVESCEWKVSVTDIYDWPMEEGVYYYILFSLKADLALSDYAETTDYYHFAYSLLPDEETGAYCPLTVDNFNYEAEPIFSEHVGQLDGISGYDAYGFTFFTDRQFSGRTYTLNLCFDQMHFRYFEEDSEDVFDCGLQLHLYSVSPSYYNSSCYLWNVDYGTLGELPDVGLAEQAAAYSNVSTGAGVVAARSRSTFTINLKDFLKGALSNLPVGGQAD